MVQEAQLLLKRPSFTRNLTARQKLEGKQELNGGVGDGVVGTSAVMLNLATVFIKEKRHAASDWLKVISELFGGGRNSGKWSFGP